MLRNLIKLKRVSLLNIELSNHSIPTSYPMVSQGSASVYLQQVTVHSRKRGNHSNTKKKDQFKSRYMMTVSEVGLKDMRFEWCLLAWSTLTIYPVLPTL